MIFIWCHYCWSLLWWNYWRSLLLWKSTSWSRLKLAVQIQLALHWCNPLLINNRNMNGNSVESYCFIVLNVELQVKLRFKTFYWLLNCYILFPPWTPLSIQLVCNLQVCNLLTRTDSLKPCISFSKKSFKISYNLFIFDHCDFFTVDKFIWTQWYHGLPEISFFWHFFRWRSNSKSIMSLLIEIRENLFVFFIFAAVLHFYFSNICFSNTTIS